MHVGACVERPRTQPRSASRAVLLTAVVVGLVASACHRPKHYETTVEITRVSAVRKDEANKPLVLDLEVSYSECPGGQLEVVRGGLEFAPCASKFKVGDKVKVGIDHEWSDEGHYKWTIRTVGDCPRVHDPNDEASYALVRECSDWSVNGSRVGFQCKYIPEQNLVDKCPWFKRR
ncbi:MAG: hypothetical protein KF764_13890 [Labilithrix sp.]|nr:hypothetical protein [Labilithrix sp.]MBX3224626.1 hypothetical protein [Labilithrix sp.]